MKCLTSACMRSGGSPRKMSTRSSAHRGGRVVRQRARDRFDVYFYIQRGHGAPRAPSTIFKSTYLSMPIHPSQRPLWACIARPYLCTRANTPGCSPAHLPFYSRVHSHNSLCSSSRMCPVAQTQTAPLSRLATAPRPQARQLEDLSVRNL